jgi:SEA/GATOR complex protein SEA4/MIOS
MGSDRHALEPLRKLASSEPITSIKFFKDQPDTLVTGVKGQFVRLYDLRGKTTVSRRYDFAETYQ